MEELVAELVSAPKRGTRTAFTKSLLPARFYQSLTETEETEQGLTCVPRVRFRRQW